MKGVIRIETNLDFHTANTLQCPIGTKEWCTRHVLGEGYRVQAKNTCLEIQTGPGSLWGKGIFDPPSPRS